MSYIDGNLLVKARGGDRESIMELCNYLADCQKTGIVPDAGATELLCDILERIGDGQAPDVAFGWKQGRKGRRNQNSAYQQWDIRLTVQERMRDGESWRAACFAVSSDADGEFLLSQKTVEQVCAGLMVDTELPIPEDIFPLGSACNKHRCKV